MNGLKDMKRMYFAALLLLLFVPWAQAQRISSSAIVIESQRGEFFQLAVGGRLINLVGTDRVAVGDLPPGRHILHIRLIGRRRAQRITAEVRLAPDYETLFVLEPVGRGRHLVLKRIEEIPLAWPHATGNSSDCRFAMSEESVSRTIEFMKEEVLDDRRLEIAKSEIKLVGGIITEDLYQLLRSLTFEDRRLDLAKFAYPYVCDRQHFSRVLDALEISSNKRDLQDFLNKQ